MGLLKNRKRDLSREDRKYVGRTGEDGDIEIVSARGARVKDANGKSYLDFQLGWCAGNLGWNHPAIAKRLRKFEGPSYVAPGHMYAPWVELARELAEITPGKLSRSYRCTTGTEADELALQIAIAATGRTKLLSIEEAYHGNSFAAKSIGEGWEVTLPNCKKLSLPLDVSALDRLETLLKHRDVAAFILEPVITNLAVEVPTDEFMIGARELCDRFGTLLIFDEVACGFGRTGKLFAGEHSGVVPDIMTMAKSITNGNVPLAATITTKEIADAVKGELDFYATFGWHPVATEAALATLAVWRDEGDDILENVRVRSADFLSRLLAMPWQVDAEVRIKGLAVAVKLEERYASKIEERCLERGLIVSAEEEYLIMFPPLTVDAKETEEAFSALDAAVRVR